MTIEPLDPDDIEQAVTDLLDVNTDHPATVVPIIATMVKAYTRGHGFNGNEPNTELTAVIATASARLAANATQTNQNLTAGPFGRDLRSFFAGWTLAELSVLNRYRVRAM